MRPFEGAGMLGLGAGSGFEGAVARYRAHIEMVEESVFHWMLSLGSGLFECFGQVGKFARGIFAGEFRPEDNLRTFAQGYCVTVIPATSPVVQELRCFARGIFRIE